MNRKRLAVLLTPVLTLSMCVPALAAENWEQPYGDAVRRDSEKWGSITKLADLDLDGVPELLVGSYPGSGLFSLTEEAYTMKNDQIAPVTLADPEASQQPLGAFQLWYRPSDGAYRITADMMMRHERGNKSDFTSEFLYNGSRLTVQPKFTVNTRGGKVTYYVNGKKTSAAGYQNAKKNYQAGWQRIDKYRTGDLTKGYGVPSAADIQKMFDSYQAGPVLAIPGKNKIQVNGAPVNMGAYNIGGNNYFKLRDIALALNGTGSQFAVTWNEGLHTIELLTGKAYTATGKEFAPVKKVRQLGWVNEDPIYLNGKKVEGVKAYNINGNNYFKLRDLGDALGFEVGWDGASSTVSIRTADAQKEDTEQKEPADSSWEDKEGKTVAHIMENGQYTKFYGTENPLSKGQCTWYCYGRFYEVTNTRFKSPGPAGTWLDRAKNDPALEVTTEITAPSIAVRQKGGGGNGHVMFVEHVDYGADGRPETVYMTEANWDSNGRYDEGTDGVVKKMSYDKFMSRDIKGFIKPAD